MNRLLLSTLQLLLLLDDSNNKMATITLSHLRTEG